MEEKEEVYYHVIERSNVSGESYGCVFFGTFDECEEYYNDDRNWFDGIYLSIE